ncbi:hypothetical protein CHUAL_000185 [Chamberlinius hualienensis]
MAGYWFIIVLVILSTHQLNAIELLDKVGEYLQGFYSYDNVCTRMTPATSIDKTLGLYKIFYSAPPMKNCTTMTVHGTVVRAKKDFTIWGEKSYYLRIIARQVPSKPGETRENKYIHHWRKFMYELLPGRIVVVAVYKQGVGYGLVGCHHYDGTNITSAMIVGYPWAKQVDIDPIKDEVERIASGIKTTPVCLFN